MILQNTFDEAREMFAVPQPEWLPENPVLSQIFAVGSRRTCDPAPMDTDDDYLVYAFNDHDMKKASKFLRGEGWKEDQVGKYKMAAKTGEFISYRKGDLNLIVSPSYRFIEKFLLASSVAKEFNIMNKAARVACFDMVFAEWEDSLKLQMADDYV